MYRKVEDFVQEWEAASAGTISAIEAITNDKLGQSIVEGHNSLGWLAWHLVSVGGAFGQSAGFDVKAPAPGRQAPNDVSEIAEAYKKLSNGIIEGAAKLSDGDMLEEVNSVFGNIPRGKLLRILIDHQTHHRGQMTVLIRQAGLNVPGVMGPTKEMQQN
ncbi:DinB family protein [Siminovitchia sediminis]|uniref:DinB family protein n=1 Tax=Siminovitchia sediminis TaxID=1274353 RepID=A0ABW4KDZ5_9BACI